MDEIPVTVDLNRLRAVANRVERSAHALSKFRVPELRQVDLPGSVVAKPPATRLPTYFDDVIDEMTAWAESGPDDGRRVRTGRTGERLPARRIVSRPTVSQARAWRPEALREVADAWDAAAGRVQAEVSDDDLDGAGSAARRARDKMTGIVQSARDAARSLVAAAVAARTGADRIGAARQAVLDAVGEADGGRVHRRRRRKRFTHRGRR